MKLKYLCKSFSNSLTQSVLVRDGKYKVYGAGGYVGQYNEYGSNSPYLGIVKDGAGVGRISVYEGQTSLLGTMAYIIPNENVDINWLKYSIQALDLGKNIDSTTIPHIYFSEYGNKDICYVEYDKQIKISDYLEKKCSGIDNIITKTQASIEEYKKLKQSIITQAVTKGVRGDREMKDSGVEMIGWIPQLWKCMKISRIANLVRGGTPRPAGDPRYFNGNFIPWITVGEVTNARGKYIESTSTYLTEEGSKKSRIIEEGTLLMSNSGATLGVPKISRIRGCINDGSVAFYNIKMNKEYLLYVLTSYTDELRKQRQGYGQPNLNTDLIKELFVPCPSNDEQKEIVEYLDKKIVKVDILINKKEILMNELEKYKQALIYEYVTGKKEVI